MDSDIAAELRTHAQVTAWNPFGSLCAAAAAEIEALRASVARLAAERDAIIAAMDDPDHALAGVRRIIGPSPLAMAAVCRATGLEEEAPR
jgi:hypothetical protein